MKKVFRWFAPLLVVFAVVGCQSMGPRNVSAQAEVRAILEQQVRDWNAGNLAGFMEAYAKSERTRFASGGDMSLGWETVFNRYRSRYGNRAAMGTLSFSDLKVESLGPDAVMAFGRWRLKRAQDEPSGLFTLIFRRGIEGWRIAHDHTSSQSP